MPDPYAPKGLPRRADGERRSELDHFLTRLEDLGADDEELAQVRDAWDDLEPDDAEPYDDGEPAWTRAERSKLVNASDHELVALLRRARQEHAIGTTDEDDQAEQERRRAYDRAMAEAQERIGGNVQAIIGWVGDDPVRAQAVHQLETSEGGANRKTLVEPLADLLAEHADDDQDDDATTAVEPQEPSDGPEGPDTPDTTSEASTDAQGPSGEAPATPERPAPAEARPDDDVGSR